MMDDYEMVCPPAQGWWASRIEHFWWVARQVLALLVGVAAALVVLVVFLVAREFFGVLVAVAAALVILYSVRDRVGRLLGIEAV